tara:strand:- start:231 stop:908 length:678 start_codon:yes stop_codon:yes gene_type:complete
MPHAYTKLFWIARNIWARIILHGSGYYVRIENREKLKSNTNCLIIANHSSHMDVFLMLIANKKPFMFVGKKELYRIPLFGYIYKRAAIMVDRSDPKSRFEVYGKAKDMLKRGYNVCIFPESHYMDDTILLADFKRGAFKIAIDNNLPIIPLIFYDLKLKHPWYPKFGSLGKLRVKVLDKIDVKGLTEEDIPMLTKKAFDTIKLELENDPEKSAVRATEKWKKILT